MKPMIRPYKAIAAESGRTPDGVKTSVSKLFRRLGAENMPHAVAPSTDVCEGGSSAAERSSAHIVTKQFIAPGSFCHPADRSAIPQTG